MSAEYIFDKVGDTELMDASLGSVIQGASVSSLASSSRFVSYGGGIAIETFYFGNLVTDYCEHITINNLTSYIFSIPKKGAYSVKDGQREEKGIMSRSGVLAFPTEKIIYDSATDTVDDYVIILNRNELNTTLEKKYKLPVSGSKLITLNLQSQQVLACYQFIESTLKMLHAFPHARNSELVKRNLKEVSTFMLVDIIAESTGALPILNNHPEALVVSKAEEIMEADCALLFSIQEVADRVYTSPRNLQLAFKKHRDYSPMQFLKLQKLHLAHKKILSSSGQKCTIKQIALDVGIFDQNRFSQNYANVFGELPSETMRRIHR